MQKRVLAGLEPEPVYRYFEEICSIPHGSGNTGAICGYLEAFAGRHGLRCKRDASDNIIIWKDGSSGFSDAPPVILQGHLDMVCEKAPDCPIDMEREGLHLVCEGGFIRAEGTTLGGDDGIAVAYALAILEADDIVHPPLEVVLTSDEEIGMLGASALDAGALKARTMLNLDSEEEGYLLVSCAGGASVTARLPVSRENVSGAKLNLKLTGLLGGHSGVEIDKGRANACQALGRVLYSLYQHAPFRLVCAEGGQKDNAIPREAEASLIVGQKTDIAILSEQVQLLQDTLRDEYKTVDGGISLQINQGEYTEYPAMTAESSRRVICALCGLPNGVERMSSDTPGLVQTSLNLGILTTSEDSVSLCYSVRSSVESEKHALVERLQCLTGALYGSTEISGDYPAWEYRENSPLRRLMSRIYAERYKKEPVIQSIHAGVECGLFAGKLPGLDCVSFGPDILDIHTPNESLGIESVKRTWEYLLEILRRLAEKGNGD